MMRLVGIMAGLALLTGCTDGIPQPEVERPAPAQAPSAEAPAQDSQVAAIPDTAAQDAPIIYLALQDDPSGTTSVIFAIDEARDATPLNDPAIRLTPEEGQCNPQELRGYPFPLASAREPVFGPREIAAGVSAQDLPSFMAVAVTKAMLDQGLITKPEQSQPQNVCTRKLWEQLVVRQSTG